MEIKDLSSYLDQISDIYKQIDKDRILSLITVLEEAFNNDRMIFVFGNGGSGASASHFCEDLGKGTLTDPRQCKRFKVMSLTDNIPYIMALANDHGYETIFEEQLKNFVKPKDIAIAISASGNSENIIRAIAYANKIGMVTVGFTGFNGGKLSGLVKYQIHVPSFDFGIVEGIHSTLMHYICDVLKNKIKNSGC